MNPQELNRLLVAFAKSPTSTSALADNEGIVLELLEKKAIKAEANAPICATGATHRKRGKLPDDPLLHAQWAFFRTGLTELWKASPAVRQTSLDWEPVKIAILDSGLDAEQQDLATCPSETSCDPGVDETGHGTAVAGVIGATTSNAFRVAGMHSGAEIHSYKVLDENNSGSIMDAVNGLAKAVEEEADIVSLAWGTATDSQCLWNAICHAEREDVLVVTAAGNDGIDLYEDPSFFPAAFRQHDDCTGRDGGRPCLKNLLVVGATDLSRDEDRRDTHASFSSYGPEVVQIGAPGVGITTTGLEHSSRLPYEPDSRGLVDASGTSVATAMVVGAAGLVAVDLRAQDAASNAGRPSQTPEGPREAEVQGGDPPFYQRILDRLLEGADRVCHLNDYFAEGRRLNVYKAVLDRTGATICPRDHHDP